MTNIEKLSQRLPVSREDLKVCVLIYLDVTMAELMCGSASIRSIQGKFMFDQWF